MQKYKYETCCVQSTAELIDDMTENSVSITKETFFKHVSIKDVHSLFPVYGLGSCIRTIKSDYHVSYHKGFYNGMRCYYLVHSAIEYIFIGE